MKKYITFLVFTILVLSIAHYLTLLAYKRSLKPVEVKVVDTEALQKLQTQFNQLQVEYDKLLTEHTTFARHLEVYERGFYLGYMRAKGYEEVGE